MEDGSFKLEIPRGAEITAVGGTAVSDFYDIIREIRRNAGRRVTIYYRLGQREAESITFDVGDAESFIKVKSTFSEAVPFKPLERLYKATGPVDAIVFGYNRTVMFIAQSYVTLKRLIGGIISPKLLIGPVGILKFSYDIVAERPAIEYAYFLGLISACLAVMNLLPLLPFDGGHLVFLLLEKIKGSPVNERIREGVTYVGLVFVGILFLYVTFNDILR